MISKNVVIIWDYDGTLVDSGLKNLTVTKKIVRAVLGKSAENFPALRSVDKYLSTITKEKNWRKFYKESFGMNEKQIDKAGILWTEYQSSDTTECPLLPGIETVLENLSAYKQGIVSQNSKMIIIENLEEKNILNYFDVIVGYEEVGLREQKPNPKGLLTAIRQLTHNNETVIYIGDQQTDIECAYNAGLSFKESGSQQKIKSVFITDGTNHKEIIPEPDHIIFQLEEIPAIIMNMELSL